MVPIDMERADQIDRARELIDGATALSITSGDSAFIEAMSSVTALSNIRVINDLSIVKSI